MNKSIWRAAIGATTMLTASVFSGAQAQEQSLISESTVVGENYGYPTGTPGQSETDVGNVDLIVEAAVFFKNHELIDLGLIEGETFYGAIVPLRARWAPTKNVTIELGAELAQNFGDDNSLETIEPIIRIVAEPADNIFVIGGTILPTHWSHQALFDDVNKFRRNAEQGLQFRADLPYWKQDLWLNWRVREEAIDAEEFELGNSTQFRFFDDTLRLDGQVHWTHAGGQISSSDRLENNLIALFGASAGVHEPMNMDNVKDLRLGANYIMSSDDSRVTPKIDGNGYEVYAESVIATGEENALHLRLSWFEGDDFIARRGDPLYSLEQYGQIGATHIWKVGENLNLEVGGVVQQTDDVTNWSASVNLTFGTAFIADFLKPR